MAVVKDISRFARNTADLLQRVRKLKALGIEAQFLTANMTSIGNSVAVYIHILFHGCQSA